MGKEMIARKNAILKESYEKLAKVEEIRLLCEDVSFTKVSSATRFIRLLGDALGQITFNRYDMLEEANYSLPEPEQVLEDEN